MTAIHTIDLEFLGRRGSIAAYVVMGAEGPVLIETGAGSTTDALVRGLAGLGLAPRDIAHVFVTHIHFDHAGAAGWMAGHGARIHVHEFGAKHLVDPSRLIASARRIYGDEMDTRWGEIVPVPPDRIAPVRDRDVLEVAGLKLRAIETPGHARHHHAFALDLEETRVCFTGDAAACYVAEAPDFISLPTPPPEFRLGAWLATIDRLASSSFDRLYPTHFGPVDEVDDHLARVRRALRAHASFVRRMIDEGLERPAMLDRYAPWIEAQAREAGVPDPKMPFYARDGLADMNLTGLLRYWTKLDETPA